MPQMTVDSTRIFGCPMCGFRVSEGDSSCPRCGNQFSSETKFECPFCGELVEQGSSECPACHVNYVEFKENSQARGGDESIDALLLEIIQLEAQSAKAKPRKLSCPGCSWMLESDEESCPRCGRDFTEDEEAFQCPICGSSVSADSNSCPECGSSFETEEPPRMIERAVPAEPEHSSEPEPKIPVVDRPADEELPETVIPEEEAEPASDDDKAWPAPTPQEPVQEAPREAPQAPATSPTGERKIAYPIRVIAKPVIRPEPARTEEADEERAARDEEAASDEERPTGSAKKSKQRKLKTRKLKPG